MATLPTHLPIIIIYISFFPINQMYMSLLPSRSKYFVNNIKFVQVPLFPGAMTGHVMSTSSCVSSDLNLCCWTWADPGIIMSTCMYTNTDPCVTARPPHDGALYKEASSATRGLWVRLWSRSVSMFLIWSLPERSFGSAQLNWLRSRPCQQGSGVTARRCRAGIDDPPCHGPWLSDSIMTAVESSCAYNICIVVIVKCCRI